MAQAISAEASAQLYSSPKLEARATLTLADGTVKKLEGKDLTSLSYDQATSSDSSFDVGGAVMGKLVLGLENYGRKWDSTDFGGATVKPYVGVRLGSMSAHGTEEEGFRIDISEDEDGTFHAAVYRDGAQLSDSMVAMYGTLVWYSGGSRAGTGSTLSAVAGKEYECRLEP